MGTGASHLLLWRWVTAFVLAMAILGKVAYPPEMFGWPRSGVWALVAVEVMMVYGLIWRPTRLVACGCFGLGLGGLVMIALGQSCNCFGNLIRVGTSLRFAVSGVLIATGASILITRRRDASVPAPGSRIPEA